MHELLSPADLENCLASSQVRPVFIYKHSTACPISWGAADRLAEFLNSAPPGTPTFFQVRVLESRPISNAVETTLHIPHQSPQLILVKERQAVWSTSHHNITAEAVRRALERHVSDETP